MNDPKATQFGQSALKSGLVTESDLAECWDRIPQEKRTPDAIDRRLARMVVDRGLLTKWQAQNLLGGLKPQGLWFDRYVLLDVLGQGGMGRVYLARDSRLGRRVALKVLSRERMNNPRAVARFRREARVGAQLQHDNLVRVYDEGDVGGSCYLVMEFIDGKSVGQLLALRGPIPAAIAVRIARQVADGLEHAARKSLVHRDVNPLNILIDRDGTAKLSDLGLAISLQEADAAVTREGATVGTFDYISPEQARHSHAIDIRSDLYSLGCTLYHMLSGRVPFPQGSLPEKLYAHQALAPTPIESLVPDLPQELPPLVRRMMAKKAEDRFESPGELARELARFESGPVTLQEIEAAPEVPIWVDPSVSTEAGGPGEPPTTEPSVGFTTAGTGSDAQDHLLGIDTESPLPVREPRRPALVFPTVPRERWRALAVLAALVALGLAGLSWSRLNRPTLPSAEPRTPPPTTVSVPTPPTTPPPVVEEQPAFAVRWLPDGDVEPQPTLQDAVRLALGKDAEVLLGDAAPIELSASRPLIISGGAVVLRAAEGAAPVLNLEPAGKTAPILVRLNGSLTLRDLQLQCTRPNVSPQAAMILAAGTVVLDHCTLIAEGSARIATALHAEGRRSKVKNCDFRGFARTLEFGSYAGTTAEVHDSLFRHDPTDSKSVPFAIQLRIVSTVRAKGARRLDVQGCTTVGMGLVNITDVGENTPLEVSVHRTVVRAPALIGWAGAVAFPLGLTWQGSDNRYAIDGPPWVSAPAPAPAGPPLPNDLAAWFQRVGAEPDSTVLERRVFPQRVESTDAGELCAVPQGVGADPSHLGPATAQGSPESR